MSIYLNEIYKKRPSKKAWKMERALSMEDLERLYSKYQEFAASIEIDTSDASLEATDRLKKDLELIFDPETIFDALVTDVGVGYILGVLVTYRTLRAQDVLEQDFTYNG
jgi:hypothetical protein